MKGQISRHNHVREKRYSGLYQIQGAMITDSDLNESTEIARRRSHDLADDAVRDGAPGRQGLVGIAADGRPHLREGIVYADGVRGELRLREDPAEAPAFRRQADLVDPPELPDGRPYLLYADIWERVVLPLEDERLTDPGLHGAQTSFRTRTMTQVKIAEEGARNEIETGTGRHPRRGNARASVVETTGVAEPDECDPCAELVSIEARVHNTLFRVEIVGVEGRANAPERIALAWSMENASFAAPTEAIPPDFGRDRAVYEVFTVASEAHRGCLPADEGVDLRAFSTALPPPPPQPDDATQEPPTFVRRWDGHAVIDLGSGEVETTGGAGPELSNRKVTLSLDGMDLHLDFDGASVLNGDYWLVERRRFAPEGQRSHLVSEEPVGILHHYCVLYQTGADGNALVLTDADRRRLSFPALTDLDARHVGFENGCPDIYGTSENVQQALDALCGLDASKVKFDASRCERLYDTTDNVQDALINLCKSNFESGLILRYLFDWGVVCGLVPRRQSPSSVAIPAGMILDRAGQLGKLDEALTVDLPALEASKGILFDSPEELGRAMRDGGACLALAVEEGGGVRVFVAPRERAMTPWDPNREDVLNDCLERKRGIDWKGILGGAIDEDRMAMVALIDIAGNAGLYNNNALDSGSLERATRKLGEALQGFEAIAGAEERRRIETAWKGFDEDPELSNAVGEAKRLFETRAAVNKYILLKETDEERRERCTCESAFVPCPPELGDKPWLVPIGCIRGNVDSGRFFALEVCPHDCRRQAMHPRWLRYHLDSHLEPAREKLREDCCPKEKEPGGGFKPLPGGWKDKGIAFDPDVDRYKMADVLRAKGVLDAVGLGPKRATEVAIEVGVEEIDAKKAEKVLNAEGVDVVDRLDIDDPGALEKLDALSGNVDAIRRTTIGRRVKPGDRVVLLVKDGVSKGYAVVDSGRGRGLYESRAVDGAVEGAVEGAGDLSGVRDALAEMSERRDALAGDLESLGAEVSRLDETSAAAKREAASAREEATAASKLLADLKEEQTRIAKATAEARKSLDDVKKERDAVVRSIRSNQPARAVVEDDELAARLSAAGVLTVGDLSKVTTARVRTLARDLEVTQTSLKELKQKASDLLKAPID